MRAVFRTRPSVSVAFGVLVLVVIGALLGLSASPRTAGAGKPATTVTPDLRVEATPGSRSIQQGETASFRITVTGVDGLSGAVTYGVAGLPTGATATFAPARGVLTAAAPAVTTVLEIGTTAATELGSRTVTVTATSGALRRSVTARLSVDAARRSFAISGGGPAAPLAPGVGAQPLDLVLGNPDHQDLAITSLVVTVAGTSAPACSAANFAVTQYSGDYPLTLTAGRQSASLSSLGVPASRRPQLVMLDLPANQDACKGVTVQLAYSGTARNG